MLFPAHLPRLTPRRRCSLRSLSRPVGRIGMLLVGGRFSEKHHLRVKNSQFLCHKHSYKASLKGIYPHEHWSKWRDRSVLARRKIEFEAPHNALKFSSSSFPFFNPLSLILELPRPLHVNVILIAHSFFFSSAPSFLFNQCPDERNQGLPLAV